MAAIEGSRILSRGVDWLNAQIPQKAKSWLEPARSRFLHARLDLRMRRGGLRYRPSFLIIGAVKGGTTSLFRYLERHPSVIAPITKEIRYFDWNWAQPLDWYWAHFPLHPEAQASQITGEASPFYLGHPLAPERVVSVLPQVKLVALLRDPIGRAVSHYQHAVRGGWERRSIEDALLAEESFSIPDVETLKEIGRPAVAYNYIARGYYRDQLERWFVHFNRSQFLIIQSELLFADPALIYNRVVNFIGLPSFQLNGMEPYNAGKYNRLMSKQLLRTLADHYAEPNRRLYDLLGVDFGWEQTW